MLSVTERNAKQYARYVSNNDVSGENSASKAYLGDLELVIPERGGGGVHPRGGALLVESQRGTERRGRDEVGHVGAIG